MASKLYVGNLSYQTESEGLRTLFAQFGEVVSATILTDRDTGRSRGFGFVEMASEDAAAAAIQALNGSEFEGRNLKVNEARERTDRRF
jgi:cold-inducible RNA-binding protein